MGARSERFTQEYSEKSDKINRDEVLNAKVITFSFSIISF